MSAGDCLPLIWLFVFQNNYSFMRQYLWITVSVLVLLLTIYDRVQVSRKYKNDSRFYSLYKKRSNICMLIYLLLLALFFFSKP